MSGLYAKAAALVGIDQFQLKHILPIDPKTWKFVESKQLYKIELLMLHGHEVGRGMFDPVNIARGNVAQAATDGDGRPLAQNVHSCRDNRREGGD